MPNDQFVPNNKHSLEEQFWHFAFAMPLARLGWLASQANLSLHGGWLWTGKTFHWPGNVKSTIRKARCLQTRHKTGLHWDHWWLPTTSQLHFCALHTLNSNEFRPCQLVMNYCQVNSEKSQIFPNTKPTQFLLGKLVATYNFATSLFCTTQSPLRTNLDHGSW